MHPIAMDVAIKAELTKMPIGADSCISKKLCIKWGSRMEESIRRHKNGTTAMLPFSKLL